ncbi:glycosyl transferase [Linderina pennispora]|uniref:Glycosyl transferase n=1 Tax=Linderina pennispora TaxID=61395 RepID=A0A1Y1VWG5_9FUNG|nr:glycosyl transferase [Linderina pennispora]ORX65630.1 glycosyl transferase [Linderina pennispora]
MGTVLYASREPRGLVNPGASDDSYEGWTGKFSRNSTKDSIYAPNGQKPVRAALVALVRNEDLYDMRKSVRELEDRWNHKYNYPYIFLNDKPFTEKFKQGIRDLTKAKVEFGTLEEGTWGYPAWIDQQRAKEEREKADYIKGGSESYRFMCRFQSGFIHKHPLLRDLEFYWRIEPEVHYYCDINYDPFVYMKKHGFKYGWNIAPDEYEPTVRTLWKTTVDFMKENPQYVADKNILDWVRNKDNTYTKCHFWSNFEIVDLSFYRSEAYQAYFDYLDRAGGFFYERWGDAPIHSIAVAMFLQKSQVHYFEDIGYYHPAMSHCPKGSKEGGSCVCDPGEGWANDFTCAKRWRAIS